MEPVDTFTIDRDGREYRVDVHVDDDPLNPRTEYEHDATEFLITSYGYSSWHDHADELTGDAGNALSHFIDRYGRAESDAIERAFQKWRAIAGSPVVLVTGQDRGYSQGDYHYWYALVDTAVMARDGYGGTPEDVAKAEADDYAAYAYGDVYGVVVTSPDGDTESVWGLVDRGNQRGERSYVREAANERVDDLEAVWRDREAERERAANLVGAGFVGVI